MTPRLQFSKKDLKVQKLKELPLFARCSQPELLLVARSCDVVHVDAGRTLALEGARADEVMVVLKGEAAVTRGGESLGTIARGKVFGDLAALRGGTHQATLTCVTPMELAVISGYEFRRLYDHVPCLARAIVDGIVGIARALPAQETGIRT
ncbi:MAG: cyclic nucleotide-binding domain-containing protein [Actinomycetota bacterium]|nr:cyclic nucleotide-binding domain-containing protein [Actinomycetota bacterium]